MQKTTYIPLWKTFTIDLQNTDDETIYILRLKQSSMWETIARNQKNIEQKMLWFDKLIKERWSYVIKWHEYKKPPLLHKNRIDNILLSNASSFVWQIIDSIDKQRVSLYENIDKKPEKWQKPNYQWQHI